MIARNLSTQISDVLVVIALTVGFGSAALAQSTAEIIRPVGQVCLAGQDCVGQSIDLPGATMASAGDQAAASAEPADAMVNTPAEPMPAPADSAQSSAQTAAQQAQASSASSAPQPAASAMPETASAASDFDAEAAYNRSCMACHMTGAAGAPKLDDDEAWETRLAKGMDAVMQNVMNGIGAMPARGLCIDCTDDQLRAVVDYMVSQ